MSTYPWLSHYPEIISWDAQIPAQPLFSLLDEAEKKYPSHIAIDFLGALTPYNTLAENVRILAASLQELGVGPGVHVGIFMPNCPQFITCYYAILKAGGTVVNYNPLYSVPEVTHQINDSETQIMITLSLNALYPKVAACLGKSFLKKIIVGDFTTALPIIKRTAFRTLRRKDIAKIPSNANHLLLEDLMQSTATLKPVEINPLSHIAVLQYTGGTTGVPKGAMLTHANVYINALQAGMWFSGLKFGEETILAALPLFHVFAMTVNMNLGILTGSTILLHPRFDLKAILRDIHVKCPSLMPGVPTMFAAIHNHPDAHKYNFTSLKMCFSGGGPLPLEVKSRFEAKSGCKLVEGYGLSESSPVASCNPLFGLNKTGSIGIPLPDTIIKILSLEDGHEMNTGEIGEVCIKGPQVMQGYFHQPEESARVLKDGFLHTGDLGYIDADGYTFIVDRLKEMIISGGYKVYPRNLEEILYQHPHVLEAAVVGVHHPEKVQVAKVYVVLKEGTTLTEAEVKAHLKDKIAAYAMPYHVEFRPVLPKSAIGKILKKMLLEEEVK